MTTRTGSGLAGLAVVALDGGERLGRLHDLVFHVASGRVTGFLVDGGGLFSRPRFLPSGQVRSVGSDALTVTAADALHEYNPALSDTDEMEARSLEGRPVMSISGSVVGKVADVLVDVEALTVAALTISTGLLNSALHGKPSLPLPLIKTVGKDSVVVSDTYDPDAAEYHGR